MRRLPGLSMHYAKPFVALTMASAVMFAMAASSDARESTGKTSEPRQRAAADDTIVVAGKPSGAFKGAAIGSRVGRSRSSDNNERDDHAEEETTERAQPAEQPDGNGPFKVIIPGQSPEEVTVQRAQPRIPAQPRQEGQANSQPAAPRQQDQVPPRRTQEQAGATAETAPSSPVRTLFEAPSEESARAASSPESDAASAAAAPTTAPASRDVAAPAAPAGPVGPSECMAGCYETTSTRARLPAMRGSGKAQPAAAQAAPGPAAAPTKASIECVAGCDGIDTGTAPPMKRGAAPAPSSDEQAARVTILRGVSRAKTYSTGQ